MRFWNRFRLRARGGRLESELCEEIRLHREMLEEQFMREGMSRCDATRAATAAAWERLSCRRLESR